MPALPPDEARARFARLEAIFHGARQASPDDRDGFLAAACGDDCTLRAEVEALLAGDASASSLPAVASPLLLGAATRALSGDPLPRTADPERVGPFRIVGRLGEGGMGTVYDAVQDSPARRVALKVIRPDAVSPETRARFGLEARVLARLDHPGVAKVYAVGLGDPALGEPPWIAMERVEGRTIRAHADAARLGVAARVALVAATADAVAHAHERGVVHRDLKPGNVLVDRSGHPRVLDFGVARLARDSTMASSLHTHVGRIVGTLAYMSPEQASGDPDAVDARSDVYALGVMAFELLAGRTPFDLDRLALPAALDRLRRDDPPTLGAVAPSLKGDLSVVVGKALARERDRRYPSAGAFADDLRRWLRHEPVSARPPTAGYLVRKFVRRHRGLVGGTALAFVCLAAGLVLALTSRAEEAGERRRADREAATARRAAYRAELAGAAAALKGGDPATARRRLDLAPASERGWEWRHLDAALRRERAFFEAPARTWRTTLLPAPGLFLAADDCHVLWVVRRSEPPGATSELETLAVTGTPVGRLFGWPLATGTASDRGGVLASLEGELVRLETLSRPPSFVGSRVPLDPRMPTLIARANGGTLGVCCRLPEAPGEPVPGWMVELATGEVLHRVVADDGGASAVSGAAFAPGDAHVALGMADGGVRVLDAGTGAERGAGRPHANAVRALAWSPDGARLLVGSDDRSATIVETRRPDVVQRRWTGFRDRVGAVAWSREGAWAAAADVTGTVRVERADSPTEGGGDVYLADRARGADGLAFQDDGTLAVVGPGGRVDLDIRPTAGLDVLRGHDGVEEGNPHPYVYAVAVSPDGTQLATGGWDRTVRVWATRADGRATSSRPMRWACPDVVLSMAFTSDGTRLAALCAGGRMRLFSTERGDVVADLVGLADRARSPLFAGPSNDVQVEDAAGTLLGVDRAGSVAPGTFVGTVRGAGCAAPSPDGRSVAFSAPSGDLVVGDLTPGAQVRTRSVRLHEGGTLCVAFAPDGRRLAAGGEDGALHVVDPATLAVLASHRTHVGRIYAVAWLPDGSRLVTGGNDGTVRIVDPLRGDELLVLEGHTAYVYDLAVFPDGETIASASGDNTVRLWSSRASTERRTR